MVMVNPGGRAPNDRSLFPEEVYQLYLRYKADELAWFLSRPAVVESPAARRHYAKACEPEPIDAFIDRLQFSSDEDRARYEDQLRVGYAAVLAETARAAAEAAREDSTHDDHTPPPSGGRS